MYWALLACLVGVTPERSSAVAVDRLISTLNEAQGLTFHVSISEAFAGGEITGARAQLAARALSFAELYVEMTPDISCAQIDLGSNGLVTTISDGQTVSVISADGVSADFDVDGDGWWDDLASNGVPPCLITSYLESWLGPNSWFAAWLDDTIRDSVADGESGQLAFYRDDGQLQQLYEVAVTSPSTMMLAKWVTFNEADIGGEEYLVARTRVFSQVAIQMPCATHEVSAGPSRKEVPIANTP